MDSIHTVPPSSNMSPNGSDNPAPAVKLPSGKLPPVEHKSAPEKPAPKKSKVDINKMVKSYNQFVKTVGTKLNFVKDEASGEMVILVKDQSTGKVIRQIPSKEMLALLAKMKNLEGMLFNKAG